MQDLLAAAREALGMDLAFFAELGEGRPVLHAIDGDTAPYGGVAPGFAVPRDSAWVEAMIGGATQLVPDTQGLPRAARRPLGSAVEISAVAGVPVRRRSGALVGALWCVSREPQPALGEHDLRYLDALARMAAERLAAGRRGQPVLRAEAEASAGQALLAALNAREHYTGAHSEAVLELALEVAAELGLEAEDRVSVGQVAMLHDIGKVGVPDAILQKPGRLTAPEWEVMREHPAIGAQIVGSIGSLAHLAPAVRAEHERWDGAGYPDGLAGDAVPLTSRICLVCDAWHAMTSDRPYRSALTSADARRELLRHNGTQFSPRTVEALLAVLDRRGAQAESAAPAGALPPLPRVRPDGPLEAELRALISVSSAVSAAHGFEEVLDVVSAEACRVLRAACVRIGRWEPDRRRVRTLINAGPLRPGEERHPADETWEPTALNRVLVERGRPYVIALDQPGLPDEERRFLRGIGRGSALAVPIRVEGRVWGVLAAYTDTGAPPFSAAHRRFAEALCAQVGTAVGRAEQFTRLKSLAYRDPLTQLDNRRSLDERLEQAVARALSDRSALSLLLCDLDGLKEINDARGHDAGDHALQQTARALSAAAAAIPGCVPCRLGGDEFCVLLVGHGPAAARRLARDAAGRLAGQPGGPLTFSSGVASLDDEHPGASDLFRAADAAQYAAKQVGRGKLFVARPGASAPAAPGPDGPSRRRFRAGRAHAGRGLLHSVLERLDGDLAGSGELARLEAVAGAFAEAFDAARWTISRRPPGHAELETLRAADRQDRRDAESAESRPDAAGERCALADHPLTAAVLERGGAFCVQADDPIADARERALLADLGCDTMSAAAAIGPDGTAWLVQLFSDRHTHTLPGVLPELRLLAAEAARGSAEPYDAAVTSRANVAKTST